MDNEKYLKDKQHYIDLYDKGTVEQCRRWLKHFLKSPEGDDKLEDIKYRWSLTVRDVSLHCLKGERYADKSETITKWMDKDRKKDELLENAKEPEGVRCLLCKTLMEMVDKSLRESLDKEDQVMFLHSCPKCKKARFFFDGGEEYIPKSEECPNCKAELKRKYEEEKDRYIIISTCPSCDYKNEDIVNLTHKKEKIDLNYEKDRKKFCISEEEGQDFIDMKMKLNHLEFLMKQDEDNKKIEQKISHIRILNISELEDLLNKELEKLGFVRLETSKPEIGRDIIVSFTIHDNKKDRSEYDSENNLKKAIKQILENTNWHLMTDGVNYRLGILSGRLKGLDSKEEISKIV